MANNVTVRWAASPAEHDYPAAGAYLELLAPAALVDGLVALLAEAPTVHRDAKDILRAARLPLLPADNPAVRRDLRKIRKGTPLSPVLLVRGGLDAARNLQVADGYHRVCASYHVNENTPVACRLVTAPAAPRGALDQ